MNSCCGSDVSSSLNHDDVHGLPRLVLNAYSCSEHLPVPRVSISGLSPNVDTHSLSDGDHDGISSIPALVPLVALWIQQEVGNVPDAAIAAADSVAAAEDLQIDIH